MRNKRNIYIIFTFIASLLVIVSCNRKPKITDTVISVKEINDIGELITAEYYGEVISGLSILYFESLDSIMKRDFTEISSQIMKADKKVKKSFEKKIVRIEEKEQTQLTSEAKDKIDRKKRRLDRRMNRKKLRSLRKAGVIESKSAFKEMKKALQVNNRELIQEIGMSDTTWETFSASHQGSINEYKQKLIKKEKGKKELIYIARGSVKAGYDLTQIDESNILLSITGDTIYMFDVDPILLDVDINPWFYFPTDDSGGGDSTLYGFQIVQANQQKKISFSEVTQVKTACKVLLRQDAIDRNIYEKAKNHAEDALEGLFSLLSLQPGQNVQKVFISHSKYFYDKVDILYDLTIDHEEFNYLESLINDDSQYPDSVFYNQYPVEYQKRLVDKFTVELYINSFERKNDPAWNTFANEYFEKRNINIEEYIKL